MTFNSSAYANVASKEYVNRITANAITNIPTDIVTQEQLNSRGYVTQAQLEAAIAAAVVTPSGSERQCNISNGNGIQHWTLLDGWGTCNTVGCNNNYYISNSTTCAQCPAYATCAGGTGATAVCKHTNEYFTQDSTICTYRGPTACSSYSFSSDPSVYNKIEFVRFYDCTGGSNGVTSFNVFAYCSNIAGQVYGQVQNCPGCYGIDYATYDKTYCYCGRTQARSSQVYSGTALYIGENSECSRYCAQLCANRVNYSLYTIFTTEAY